MLKKTSIYTILFYGALGSAAAIALQPTVRAGSLSLNNSVKPTPTTVTPTSSSNTTNRGSTVSKFSTSVVPVSMNSNSGSGNSGSNNDSVSSAVLAELQQEIDNLRRAQLELENSQLKRSDIEDAVEEMDLTSTNRELRRALTDINTANQDLQTTLENVQQQTAQLNESLDDNVDNRLRVRGLIDGNNGVPFARKADIEPNALAQKIVNDTTATNTLSEKITPKESDIKTIIAADLKDRQILKNDGSLNVEKKGEIQVNETTVTNALRNSSNFKDLVSDAVETKGYVTEGELENKNFLTTNSDTFRNLATKTEIAPRTIAESIANDLNATAALSGKIGPDSTEVNRLISTKLQNEGILDSKGDLQVATKNEVSALDTKFVKPADITADKLEATLSETFAKKGEVGTDATEVNNLIATKLQNEGILDDKGTLQVATKNEVSALDKKFVKPDDITADKLEVTLSETFAKKGEVPQLDDQAIASALGNSTIVTDAVDSALSNNKTFATKDEVSALDKKFVKPDDITADKLEVTLSETFAKKGEVPQLDDQAIAAALGNSTIVTDAVDSALDKNTTFAKKVDVEKTYATKSEISGLDNRFANQTDVQTLQTKVTGGVNDKDSILYNIATNSDLRELLKGPQGDPGRQGEPGAPGTGIEYQDEVQTCDGLDQHTGAPKGYAWLNKQDGLLYISNGTSFPDCPNGGAPFKGDPGETAWHAYCEANWSTVVSKLFSNISDCNGFTAEDYNALMGGAKAYCLHIAQDPSKLDAANGLGLKLRRVLQDDTIVSRLKSTKVGTKIGSISFVDACEAKYNEIMEPDTPWYTYCTEDNHLANIITPLYPSVTNCDNFTSEYYYAILGGAKAYCLSLAEDLSNSKLDLTAGIGKKLSAKLVADNSNQSIEKLKGATLSTILNSKFNSGNNFVRACEARYNEIMAGENAETVEMTYCKAAPEGNNFPSGTINLDLIKKLYTTVQTCDDFTASMYAAITGGADAYCMSLTNNFQKVSLNDGVGLKITKLYMKKTGVTDLATAKNAMTAIQNKAPLARLTDTTFQGVSLWQACKDNYNDIMSGKDADNAWYAYCAENNRLETIIKPLYSDVSTCDDFDSDKYAAIMGGAKAYCLSLTNNLIAGKVDFTTGIGKRLAAKLDGGSTTKLNSFKGKSLATVLNRSTSTYKFGNLDFVSACEQKYNEIMAGEDGQDGQDGNDGDDAATVWCKAHTRSGAINGTALLQPAKMMRMYERNTSISSKITISSGQGYFTNLQACLDAVAADPSLMGGESAAEQDFDSNNSSFAKFDTNALTRFQAHRSGFVASLHGTPGRNADQYEPVMSDGKLRWKKNGTLVSGMEMVVKGQDADQYEPVMEKGLLKWKKNGTLVSGMEMTVKGDKGDDGITYMPVISKGMLSWKNAKTGEAVSSLGSEKVVGENGKPGADGKNGTDGKTWRPTFSNGKISWTQSNDSSEISNFDVKATALAGVKEELGGSSSSNLTSLINAKADARINAQASNLLTVQDLTNIINSGALQIGSNNKVTISSSATANDSSTSSSLNKLNGTDGASISITTGGSCTNSTCGTNAGVKPIVLP